MIAVFSSTAIVQFIVMAIIIVLFLMAGVAYMPWKDERLAQFDNSISVIVMICTVCGIGLLHLSVEKDFYIRDDSEKAQKAKELIQGRINSFSLLLALSLGAAAFLFFVLFCYCLRWMKYSTNIAEKEAAAQQALLSRYLIVAHHEEFQNQLTRFLQSGTHVDLRSFDTFVENMEARCGATEGNGTKRGTTKRLRVSMSNPTVPSVQKLRISMIEADTHEMPEEVRSSWKAATENAMESSV